MREQPNIWVFQSQNTGDTNNRRAIAAAISPDNHRLIDLRTIKQIASTGEEDWPDIFLTGEEVSYVSSQTLQIASEGRSFVVGVQAPDINSNVFEERKDTPYDYMVDHQLLFSHLATAQFDVAAKTVCDFVPTYIDNKSLQTAFNTSTDATLTASQNGPTFLLVLGSVVDASRVFGHVNWRCFPEEVEIMQDNFRQITRKTAEAAKACGGNVLVTTSRRTNHSLLDIVHKELKGTPSYIYDWSASDASNPYIKMLATADRIIVSADSISMTADALATGKPTFIYVPSEKPEETKDLTLLNALKKTSLLCNETNLYMQHLAREKLINPMRMLQKDNIREKPAFNPAAEIASDLIEAYHQFCERAPSPAHNNEIELAL